MAVEGELDERAPRDHPVGAEQLEHILLALLAATAARIAALDAAATMVAAAIASPSLPRLAVVLRIWAVFGECEACNLLIIKDLVLSETNVVP